MFDLAENSRTGAGVAVFTEVVGDDGRAVLGSPTEGSDETAAGVVATPPTISLEMGWFDFDSANLLS